MITFTIPGPPKGKARPRIVRSHGKVHSYTPDATVAYEELVRIKYLQAAGGKALSEKPIEISIVSGFPIPKSTSRKDRERMLEGIIRPTKRPDLDNIGKIVYDALNGIAYHDDAQIVDSYEHKVYVDGPGKTTVTLWGIEEAGGMKQEKVVHCGQCKWCVHQVYAPPEVEWICIEYHNYCDCGAKIVTPNFFCGYGEGRDSDERTETDTP